MADAAGTSLTSGFLFDRLNPEPVRWDRECPLPVAPSSSRAARPASATGAQVAAVIAGVVSLRYIHLLEKVGEASDHEASRVLGVGLSSINSTRSRLERWIIESGNFDRVTWPNGHVSERTRWRLRTPAEVAQYDADQATQAMLTETS